MDFSKLFPNLKKISEKELKDKEKSLSVGDHVRVVKNIRCRQAGKSGVITKINPEDKHGWKSFVVKFDDSKYGSMAFQSGDLNKTAQAHDKKYNLQGLTKLALSTGEAVWGAGAALPVAALLAGGYAGHRLSRKSKSKLKRALSIALGSTVGAFGGLIGGSGLMQLGENMELERFTKSLKPYLRMQNNMAYNSGISGTTNRPPSKFGQLRRIIDLTDNQEAKNYLREVENRCLKQFGTIEPELFNAAMDGEVERFHKKFPGLYDRAAEAYNRQAEDYIENVLVPAQEHKHINIKGYNFPQAWTPQRAAKTRVNSFVMLDQAGPRVANEKEEPYEE